jgi:hypothetical protein
MSLTARALAPPADPTRGIGLALAALGPIALGGILAVRAQTVTPLAIAPAIIFGVAAATSPALYIALAAAGDAPPLARVARAFRIALGAFGVALAGLVLPAAFLSLSSLSPLTTVAAVTAALAAAGLLALRRLATELTDDTGVTRSLTSQLVFVTWSIATLGIVGRLWVDLAQQVLP